MQKPIIILVFLLLAVNSWGVPIACPITGTYQTLLGTNADGGCIINDKLFSLFSLSAAATGGATAITASQMVYTVVNNFPIDIGFTFTISGLAASSGQSNDVAISYLVAMLPGLLPQIISGHLAMTAATTGTGIANIGEVLNIGCGTSICPDVPGVSFAQALSTVVGGGNDKTNDAYQWAQLGPLDKKPFVPVSQVFITKDINVLGGSNGFASISIVQNTVDQVPEPITFSLLGSGLLLVGFLRRRRRN
jgi:hypothetical protein